eukprot:g12080.t1
MTTRCLLPTLLTALLFGVVNGSSIVLPLALFPEGCFADVGSDRVMEYRWTDDAMTVERCNGHCLLEEYHYFALQSGDECWCADSTADLSKHGSGTCDENCAGNPSQNCGGHLAFVAYEVAAVLSPNPSPTPVMTIPSSCGLSLPDFNWVEGSGVNGRLYADGTDVDCGGCFTMTDLYNFFQEESDDGGSEGPVYVLDDDNNVDYYPNYFTGKWLLTSELYATGGATFYCRGTDVGGDCDELRIESMGSDAYHEIRGHGGNLYFENTVVTSWDTSAKEPQETYENGRSFLNCVSERRIGTTCAKNEMGECRMDIINSEMGYMGYAASESYGLTWKVRGFCPNSSNPEVFDNVNVYGDIKGSNIHHMYYGMYSYGHQGGVWINNKMHDNIIYGFDPHDDSDYLTIAYNEVYNNANHGIIASKRCDNLKIYGNKVRDGGEAAVGIFLHRSSNDCEIYGNRISNMQAAGIALLESFGADIHDNVIYNALHGIRLHLGSGNNEVYVNKFDNITEAALFTYIGSDDPEVTDDGRPFNNEFYYNEITNTEVGVKFKDCDDITIRAQASSDTEATFSCDYGCVPGPPPRADKENKPDNGEQPSDDTTSKVADGLFERLFRPPTPLITLAMAPTAVDNLITLRMVKVVEQYEGFIEVLRRCLDLGDEDPSQFCGILGSRSKTTGEDSLSPTPVMKISDSCELSLPDFNWAEGSGVNGRMYADGTDVNGGGCFTMTDLYNFRGEWSDGTPKGPVYVLDDDNNVDYDPDGFTGKWLLTSELYVTGGATFYCRGTDVGGDCDELRIESMGSDAYHEIRGHGGNLYFENTVVTSWDTSAKEPQETYEDGRSFLNCVSERDIEDHDCIDTSEMGECRMDIINSEMGYMGYYASESYGLTWKVRGFCTDSSNPEVFDLVNVYGDIIGSDIHHMYYGMYSYGHQGGVWTDNKMHDNIIYGFDPHDDSDYLTIARNTVYNNNNHGIIASKRCDHLKIYENEVFDGGVDGSGIFLHRSSNDCEIYDNEIYDMQNAGISVHESYRGDIYNNKITDTKWGIRVHQGSADNTIRDNVIDGIEDAALFTYIGSDDPEETDDGRPFDNEFYDNEIKNTALGVKLWSSDNIIIRGEEGACVA